MKAKVKKKSNFLRAHATTAIKQGDPFDVIATELAENPFDSNDDFEKYFTLSKQLNTFLKFDLVKQQTVAAKTSAVTEQPMSKPAAETNADFMTADVKNEFTIIKTIHEMINLSSILKVKIDHYNSTNLKKPLRPVQPIEFASVIDIQKIFSTEKIADSKSTMKSAA